MAEDPFERVMGYAKRWFGGGGRQLTPMYGPGETKPDYYDSDFVPHFVTGNIQEPKAYLEQWVAVIYRYGKKLGFTNPRKLLELSETNTKGLETEVENIYPTLTTSGRFWAAVLLSWGIPDFMTEMGIIPSGSSSSTVFVPHPSASLVAVLAPIINLSDDPLVAVGTSTAGTVVVVGGEENHNDHDAAVHALTEQLARLNSTVSREASARLMQHEFCPIPSSQWRQSWEPTMASLIAAQRAHPHISPMIQGYMGTIQ